tara:strand:- start:671 stop:934 length:264 start_codon:yes stop_codon:yes gene_type:complete
MKIIEIQPETVESFRREWPCNNLANVDHIVAAFADNGDLVDVDCCDIYSEPIDGIDGPCLVALLDNAQRKAYEIRMPPGTIGPIWKY